MNRQRFYDTLRHGLLGPALSQDEVDGCEAILDSASGWSADWTAYALATAFHETAHSLMPVHEAGDAAYFRRRYDPQGLNPHLADVLGNTVSGDGARYAGRGFVQITGRALYRRLGERLGIGLEADPDLALQPAIAARILGVGMAEGLFTGKCLGDYFNASRCDPLSARRIVNGLDRASEIAGYFARFREALG